jgi:hypothetical protein
VLGADKARQKPVNELGYIHIRFVVSCFYGSAVALARYLLCSAHRALPQARPNI